MGILTDKKSLSKRRTFRFAAVLGAMFLGIVIPALSQEVETLSTLRFKNGDSLKGSLIRISADGHIMWKTPLSSEEISFREVDIEGIILGTGDEPQGESVPRDVIVTTTHERLPCKILSLDRNRVTIETPYTEPVSVERKSIAYISFSQGEGSYMVNGFGDLKEWSASGQGIWRISNNSVYSLGDGYLSRDCSIPDRVAFRFLAAWKTAPRFRFFFGSDRTLNQKSKSSHYYIYLSQNSLMFYRYSLKQRKDIRLGSVAIPAESGTSKNHQFEIRYSRLAKSVSVYLNQKLVAFWSDHEGEPMKGTWAGFRSERNYPIRLRNFQVRQWNGNHSGAIQLNEATDSDQVFCRDDDAYTGKILNIRSNGEPSLAFGYRHGDLNIPLSHVRYLNFHTPQATAKDLQNFDAVVYLYDGHLRMQVSQVTDTHLEGTSAAFGKVSVSRKAITRIQVADSAANDMLKRSVIRNLLWSP